MNIMELYDKQKEKAKEELSECLQCYHSILRAIGSMVKNNVPSDDINLALLMEMCYRTYKHYINQSKNIELRIYPDIAISQIGIDTFKQLNMSCRNLTNENYKKQS